ncbi:virginiamycin B lyase family protein [Glaciecola sp. 2405UD65-10]|uniref:Vgb family protein n=1 Tax=Glaciecola sp. 2405UD65-10 TaxID=3397244 RepID=UPI003B59BB95
MAILRKAKLRGLSWKLPLLLGSMFVLPQVGYSQALPNGDGKALVQSICSACHNVNRISNSLGYSKADWTSLIASMVNLQGNEQQHEQITQYLAKHFPPTTNRNPRLINGSTQITITEWMVPTLGQRSRDPVEGPNGDIWWVGQWGNILGRINPNTNEMKEYALPPGAMPHSVTPDAQGNMWYTGNKNGSVGRLNPNTGKIDVFNMPDASARDPHTGVFDSEGIFWFTLQHSNQIGRLNPSTGKIDLKELPTKGSRPYGIKVADSGDIWVACNGSNCLIKVSPENFELQEIKLPHDKTKVRRLSIADDQSIWYVNSSRGRLGNYNPATGKIREWPSPSGEKSHPYAIEVLNGAVWYNESGMRPDALVKFDPNTETFQSWPVPSGDFYAGIIRHMRPTKSGALLIHQSATNRIMRVDISESSSPE